MVRCDISGVGACVCGLGSSPGASKQSFQVNKVFNFTTTI